MTDRIHSLQVVLEKDIREDDVESLIQAIKHFRFVLDVVPAVASLDSIMAECRASNTVKSKLIDMMRGI